MDECPECGHELEVDEVGVWYCPACGLSWDETLEEGEDEEDA